MGRYKIYFLKEKDIRPKCILYNYSIVEMQNHIGGKQEAVST